MVIKSLAICSPRFFNRALILFQNPNLIMSLKLWMEFRTLFGKFRIINCQASYIKYQHRRSDISHISKNSIVQLKHKLLTLDNSFGVWKNSVGTALSCRNYKLSNLLEKMKFKSYWNFFLEETLQPN